MKGFIVILVYLGTCEVLKSGEGLKNVPNCLGVIAETQVHYKLWRIHRNKKCRTYGR